MMNRRRFLKLALGGTLAASWPHLRANTAAANAIPLQAGPARLLPPEGIFGVDGRLVESTHPWTHQAGLLAALQDSAVPWLRYPGRGVAEVWDWQTGWIDSNPALSAYLSPVQLALQSITDRAYPLSDLQTPDRQVIFTAGMACRNLRLNGEPHLAPLDAAAPALQHFLDGLAAAQPHSIGVHWAELGDGFAAVETWHNSLGQRLFGNDPNYHTAYPQVASQWAQALRAQFPGIRVAFHGAPFSAPTGQPVLDLWNSHAWAAFGQQSAVDAMAVQLFLPAHLGVRAGEPFGTWGTAAEQEAQHLALQDPAVLESLFCDADSLLEDYLSTGAGAGLRQTPFQLLISAFNIHDPVGALRHTWAHGLVTASLLNAFLREPRVALAVLHNAASMPHGAVLLTASQFEGLVLPETTVDFTRLVASLQPFTLAPAGRVMKLFIDSMTGMRSVQSLQPAGAPRETVWGLLFADGGLKANLLLANLTHQPVTLDSATLFAQAPYRPGDFTLQSWHAVPNRLITRQAAGDYPEFAISTTQQFIPAGGQIILPPYALSHAWQLTPQPADLRQLHLPLISTWRAP